MKFIIDRVPLYMGRGVSVRMLTMAGDKAHYVTLSQALPISQGEVIPEAMSLSDYEAQQLCDALWEAGVRPTNGEGSTGQLAATQAHLSDMRAVAFNRLGIKEDRP